MKKNERDDSFFDKLATEMTKKGKKEQTKEQKAKKPRK